MSKASKENWTDCLSSATGEPVGSLLQTRASAGAAMEFTPPLLRLGWGGNDDWNSFSLLLGRDFFFFFRVSKCSLLFEWHVIVCLILEFYV